MRSVRAGLLELNVDQLGALGGGRGDGAGVGGARRVVGRRVDDGLHQRGEVGHPEERNSAGARWSQRLVC